jgi:hypothetical protein
MPMAIVLDDQVYTAPTLNVVEADVAALDNTMFDTTVVVVVVGTVYRVVLDVAAAVRAIALVVVAISYYLSLLECFHKKQS